MDNLKETEKEKQKRIKAWKLRQKRYWFNRITEEKGIKNVVPEIQVSLLPFSPEQEQLETLMLIKEQGINFFYDVNMCTEFLTKTEMEDLKERRKKQEILSHYKKLGFKNVKIKERKEEASKKMSTSAKFAWDNLTEEQREERVTNISKGVEQSRRKKAWDSKVKKPYSRPHKHRWNS